MKELKEILDANKAPEEKSMTYPEMISKVQTALIAVVKKDYDRMHSIRLGNDVAIIETYDDNIMVNTDGHVKINGKEFDLTEDDKLVVKSWFERMKKTRKPVNVVEEAERIADERGVSRSDAEAMTAIIDEILDPMSDEQRKACLNYTIEQTIKDSPLAAMLSGLNLMKTVKEVMDLQSKGKASEHPMFKGAPEEIKKIADTPLGAMMMGAALCDVLHGLHK